jgi:hypothetical protein
MAIIGDWERGDAAGAVVSDEEIFAGFIEEEVAWAGAHGGLLVDEGELAGLGVDGEGAEAAGGFAGDFVDLIDGEEEAAFGVEFEE